MLEGRKEEVPLTDSLGEEERLEDGKAVTEGREQGEALHAMVPLGLVETEMSHMLGMHGEVGDIV